MMRILSRLARPSSLHTTFVLTVAIGSTVLGVAAAAQPADPAIPLSLGDELTAHMSSLREAAIALPLATLLGAALALRPRRKGTPRRSPAVIETQIILALMGALVMLVVGASLARAFGVVGIAGLIRYRAKIDDPKDASVMLSTLGVGLAAGVGLYMLSAFATAFIMIVLSVLEWLEPVPQKHFTLKVANKEVTKLQPQVEQLLRRQHVRFELRTSAPDEICYDVFLPIDMRTDRISNAIQRLDEADGATVEWDEKKKKDQAA